MKRTVRFYVIAGAITLGSISGTARAADNLDEDKVGTYTLPDPLVMQDGQSVRDAETWIAKRRPEILHLFEENMQGRIPPRPENMSFDVFDVDQHALDGKAIRKQITVNFFGQPDGPKMNILLYLPADAPKPVPTFLCLQFNANHHVMSDPGIKITQSWVPDPSDKKKRVQKMEDDSTRGTSKQLRVEEVLARGYGIAAIYYCDIVPDFNGGMKYGVGPYLYPGQTEPRPDDCGAIGAWAWGASRAMDYLVSDKDVDAKRVIMLGQSRLGKTALWIGARSALCHDHRRQFRRRGRIAFAARLWRDRERLERQFPISIL